MPAMANSDVGSSMASRGKMTAPTPAPNVVITTMENHIRRIVLTRIPWAFMLPEALMLSGKLLRKTPTTKGSAAAAAEPLCSPPDRLTRMPMTRDSGTASMRMPSHTISAACFPRSSRSPAGSADEMPNHAGLRTAAASSSSACQATLPFIASCLCIDGTNSSTIASSSSRSVRSSSTSPGIGEPGSTLGKCGLTGLRGSDEGSAVDQVEASSSSQLRPLRQPRHTHNLAGSWLLLSSVPASSRSGSVAWRAGGSLAQRTAGSPCASASSDLTGQHASAAGLRSLAPMASRARPRDMKMAPPARAENSMTHTGAFQLLAWLFSRVCPNSSTDRAKRRAPPP
mmetsp:Transcript_68094/g.175543  ORF Transcript_68094/g.175543 Transcript_68094/m.175543 type:complete len:341 (-) Transcript_68094:258-1280(-)